MKRQTIDTFGAAVSYLCELPRFTRKNTMEDTWAYLGRLGSPDKKIRHVIHVAGTNGKGSVCAYLRSILEEAGYTTAVFTSPHLVDIRERFTVRGGMISREDFLRAFLQVYDGLNWEELEQGTGYHPTFFEYLFFMAMLLFSEADCDYCILETGLGGRLDATNAVSRKDLAVITRIGLDHTEYLGDTLAEIAGEKAGIMCAGAPCVYCDEVPEASAVFAERAQKLRTEGVPVSKKDYTFFNFSNKTIDFSLHTRYYGYIRVILHTTARYQMENAALAAHAAETLDRGRSITAAQIRRGLEQCFWPGRMEEILPEVYVDGAHNEDGIRAFLDTVAQDGCRERGQSRSLLFSVVSDKDYGAMAERILRSGCFDRIVAAPMETGRALSLEELRETFMEAARAMNPSLGQDRKGEEAARPVLVFYDSVYTAFTQVIEKQRQGERVYIAGSLYLVGKIKEFLRHD